MSDRLKLPPIRDFGFYQRRKHDKWREVPLPSPALEAPVADSHAHLHMLPDPAWELARCAANGVDYVCSIVDPSEDGAIPFEELNTWVDAAKEMISRLKSDCLREDSENLSQNRVSTQKWAENEGASAHLASEINDNRQFSPDFEGESVRKPIFVTENEKSRVSTCEMATPIVRLAVGVHPHNAKLYDDAIEHELLARLDDPRVVALGEIGLDFHYDLSPRDVQEQVFRRQIALAKEAGLPVALHLRGGDDPEVDDAHRRAFDILQEEGFPERGTLLHCCALPPDELKPWVEAGCYIAYGGALTFKSADVARAGACIVPADRLLLETDSPYMTPEPMRGAACTPAHVVFTAAVLAEVRGAAAGEERKAFLEQLHANALRFYCER